MLVRSRIIAAGELDFGKPCESQGHATGKPQDARHGYAPLELTLRDRMIASENRELAVNQRHPGESITWRWRAIKSQQLSDERATLPK